eukprot:562451-Amphidinium_carterae.1
MGTGQSCACCASKPDEAACGSLIEPVTVIRGPKVEIAQPRIIGQSVPQFLWKCQMTLRPTNGNQMGYVKENLLAK